MSATMQILPGVTVKQVASLDILLRFSNGEDEVDIPLSHLLVQLGIEGSRLDLSLGDAKGRYTDGGYSRCKPAASPPYHHASTKADAKVPA